MPFFKDVLPQLGLFYIVITYFALVGTSNAVNLTDGLDGLAIVPTILVAAALAIIAYLTGNINFSAYLHIPHLPLASELVVVCTAIVGAGLVGSLCALYMIRRGYNVTIFDRKKSKFLLPNQKMIIGDIFHYDALERAIKGNQIIYNFAALSDLDLAMNQALISAKTNILGTVQALNLCRKYKVKRFIHASSIYATSNQGGFTAAAKEHQRIT